MAFQTPGNEVQSSCDRCPTDLSFLVNGNVATLRAWHDFGSRGSSLDLSWRIHVRDSENTSKRGPSVDHRPGAIRRLYSEEGL